MRAGSERLSSASCRPAAPAWRLQTARRRDVLGNRARRHPIFRVRSSRSVRFHCCIADDCATSAPDGEAGRRARRRRRLTGLRHMRWRFGFVFLCLQ